jgi:hypothetical protein
VAIEAGPSGCSNGNIRRHIHFILVSNAVLHPEQIEERWDAGIGNCKIEAYDHKRDGIGYLLKMYGTESCDLDLSENLWLFQTKRTAKNKKERRLLFRSAERHERRLKRLAANGLNF